MSFTDEDWSPPATEREPGTAEQCRPQSKRSIRNKRASVEPLTARPRKRPVFPPPHLSFLRLLLHSLPLSCPLAFRLLVSSVLPLIPPPSTRRRLTGATAEPAANAGPRQSGETSRRPLRPRGWSGRRRRALVSPSSRLAFPSSFRLRAGHARQEDSRLCMQKDWPPCSIDTSPSLAYESCVFAGGWHPRSLASPS